MCVCVCVYRLNMNAYTLLMTLKCGHESPVSYIVVAQTLMPGVAIVMLSWVRVLKVKQKVNYTLTKDILKGIIATCVGLPLM